jgi:hypothetical protein
MEGPPHGVHHLHTSQVAEPDRVAAALRALWAEAELH